ncbi:MAG: DMT family transporter [Actinomycetia bacterium]|nr:DMT family transporter [Actinomycetes bacterium]
MALGRTGRLAELVVAAAGWGATTVAIKIAVRGIPPMTVLFVQLVTATAVLWIVFAIKGIHWPANVGRFALTGVFEPGVTFAAVDFGLSHTSAASASLLAGAESVFVVILAMIFLRERPAAVAFVAVAIALVGVAVLSGAAPTASESFGNAFVLAGTLSAACYVTLASTVAPGADTAAMTAYQFLAGTVVGLPFVAAQWISAGAVLPSGATAGQWGAAVFAGVIGLAAAYLLYNHAAAVINVTLAGMTINLIPVFGLIAAITVLGERLRFGQIVGAALIVLALVVFTAHDGRRLRGAGHAGPGAP